MTSRTYAAGLLRLIGRLGAVALAGVVFVLVGVQFARMIGDNVSMARQLAQARTDIRALRARRREQLQEVRRLSDPRGAVPEIHDRLRLVRPNEEIIFVKPAPSIDP